MANQDSVRCIKNLVTAESGQKQASIDLVEFTTNTPQSVNTLDLFPEDRKQLMQGVGTSFTQSSAYVLAHLSDDERNRVMEAIYGESGANFALARSHIGACDFCVDGKYSYADIPDDKDLSHFSIEADNKPFDLSEHPDLIEPSFTLLPMIQAANRIKARQGDEPIQIIASAWTAPPWMKDIEDWYITADYANGIDGTGGQLKPEYQITYAQYLVKYLDAYQEQGVPIWGLTPVNEPHGNNGQWESMNFTPQSQCDFIKESLGPSLQSSQHKGIKLLIYDQNRDGLEEWTDVILADPDAAQYVYGTAVHWYESTYKVYEDTLDSVHDQYPHYDIIHTEGCIDDLGKPAPAGIMDPDGFQESGWFENDDFWWNDNATDWAYTAVWANAEDHPKYTPVHRYARNIIVSFNHWMSGWIDWNIVLDHQGGPNHVGNFCGAPIMINRETKAVYYTPVYHVLSQLSQSIRPGDYALQIELSTPGLDKDALHACATRNGENIVSVQILNTCKSNVDLSLSILGMTAEITLYPNSVQTIQLDINPV